MARLSIDRIAPPAPDYRIRRNRTPLLGDFETGTQARVEDRRRVQGARRRSVRVLLREEKAKRLIRSIVRSGRRLRRSLASAIYMRNLRQRVSGQIWWLAIRTANLQPRTFTLFPRGWEVPAGKLSSFNPIQRLAALRSLINRCGGTEAGGYLILFIHGEFEPRRRVYQIHVHGLAAGALWRVINEKVRKTPSVRTIKGAYGRTDFVRHRLRMDGELTDLPRPLTYLLKSYWPSRAQYLTPEGRLRRHRRATRIPEPYHTEVLLWLDRWRLSDLSLMMNLSVDRTGFRLADRAYTNGDDQ